jgi:8-oxo-dGTP pyrophosphatase MutT (NUDIX family)
MQADRPAPDEALNPGPTVTPRPAATVILLRGAAELLEILLVKRNPRAWFMAGAWVFPGGAVDRHEGRGEPALRAAALRELREEAGVELSDPDALIGFSRWITPEEIKTRFDTWFYLAAAPAGVEPRVDGQEVVEARWYQPAKALRAARAREIALVFPTIKHLEQLARFPSTQAVLEHTRAGEVVPVEPRVVVSGETARVVLPGEPGYDD